MLFRSENPQLDIYDQNWPIRGNPVQAYPSLISFRGKYYCRSGSTMREITGKELERALLKTQGRTWDGVPLPKL